MKNLISKNSIKIALIGNPNSGKTTLFNSITKLYQTVGNWPGVTIEKKEGRYHKDKSIKIIDLPGIYSLTPYSLEEKIARDYLINENPDIVINIIDATNLERNLYLTTQLMEMGIKTVIALNMSDELQSEGISVDEEKLTTFTGMTTVSISALRSKNIDKLMSTVLKEIKQEKHIASHIAFEEPIEKAIEKIENRLTQSRFISIKILEQDMDFFNSFVVSEKDNNYIANIIASIEKHYSESINEVITNQRYKYLETILPQIQTHTKTKRKQVSEKIDKIITNKYLAFPIFILVIWLMYFISIQTLGGWAQEAMEDLLEFTSAKVAAALASSNIAPWLVGLISDGILTGVGTILTFLPQIVLLFLFISFLEGCGYMARVAFIMDRLFKRIGLSGKSFIPMIVGCGCSVPAIMSARTIENNDERRLTIMLTPFIPCSAKLPIFALFVGAFFPNNPFVAPSMYLLGIATVIVGGLILKKLKIFKTQSDTFVLELPSYRWPTFKNILLNLWEKAKSFVIKAGTIIFLASIIIWVLQNFNWKLQMVEPDKSLIATIGNIIAPLFKPLGFGDWRVAVALVTGTIAKETVVSTLSILLGGAGNISHALGTVFSPVSAYAFMAFVLLSSPCVAALGATKKEMGSTSWLLITIAFQFLTAYIISFIIYNISSLFLYDMWIVLIPVITITCLGIVILTTKYIKKRGICANANRCGNSKKNQHKAN